MAADCHFTRINTQELKDVIYQKIGPLRADKYFEQLKRFLGYKLSKADLDRSCLQTIGRENIPLHNRLIRAIIQNSCQARIPPHKPRKAEGHGVRTAVNGYQRSCFQSLYGDGLPSSPRKCRSPRERKFRDRPSPLGPLGKSPSLTIEETVSRIQEQSAAELHSISSRKVEEGEEVEQFAEIPGGWRSITAPLGIPIKSHKSPHPNFAETCQSSGELPDTISLMSRLENRLAAEGISITLEGANALNKGMDAYLKRMLEAFPSVRGSGSPLRPQQHSHLRQKNEIQTQPTELSMPDLRVAMETNPCVLGGGWPTLLEKINHHSFQSGWNS